MCGARNYASKQHLATQFQKRALYFSTRTAHLLEVRGGFERHCAAQDSQKEVFVPEWVDGVLDDGRCVLLLRRVHLHDAVRIGAT